LNQDHEIIMASKVLLDCIESLRMQERKRTEAPLEVKTKMRAAVAGGKQEVGPRKAVITGTKDRKRRQLHHNTDPFDAVF